MRDSDAGRRPATVGLCVLALLVAGCGGEESTPGDGAGDAPEPQVEPRGAEAIDVFARARRWDRVLEVARTIPPEDYSLGVMHDVQRALFHRGRLLDEMFAWPQTVQRDGRLLFSALAPRTAHTAWKMTVTFFELGHVNLAEVWAHFTMEIEGPRAAPLKLLSRVYLLRNKPQMARTCLGALAAADPSQRDWVRERLARFDAETDLAGDPELVRLRRMMPVKDYARGPGVIPFRQYFIQLLDTNRDNRMALAYLVAFDLWSRRADLVVDDLRWLEATPDARLPRHWQEAVLVFLATRAFRATSYADQQRLAATWTSRVDASVRTRFREFNASMRVLLRAPRNERPALLAAIEKTYGGDWYYHAYFGYSAAGKTLKPVDVVTGATE